jgi:hypothetical protein
MTRIYLLERNRVPFYVGKTLQKIKDHFYTHGERKINSKIIEIDIVEDNEWRFWESWYIELFKSWGFELENKNNGGGGRGPGWISSPERNAKIKSSMKNHSQYYTNEIKEKISKNTKGIPKPFTEEHRHNMEVAKRKQAKTVLMFDLENNIIREWESKGQAAKWIQETKGRQGNLTSQIKDAIFGRQKTAFGYKWKYK